MEYKLDRFQEEAVKTRNRNTLIVAAPGSGKTTVIVNRVHYLSDTLKVPDKNIIVITFTKMAAMNMKNRYKEKFKTQTAPFFGTFHGLFYKIVSRHIGKVDIIDERIVYKLVGHVLEKYFDEVKEDKIKEIINNISIYKTSGKSMEEFEPTVTNDIFTEVYETYENYKRENGKMDFDDLTVNTLNLFKTNKELLYAYRDMFKYMLVDEFQDCDALQIEFLKLINGDGKSSLFAVGDEDQCIYSFRGSKPEYMVTFDKIFESGKKLFLAVNYRSRKNIIEASKKIIKCNRQRNNKEILWNNEDNGEINFFSPVDERNQGGILSEIINEKHSEGISYSRNAVLYRTNIEAIEIIESLMREKIPFNLLDREYNFYDHFVCRDLTAYLKAAYDIYDTESFLRIINRPFRYVSKAAMAYVKSYRLYEPAFEILMKKDDIHSFQKNKLDDLRKDFNYLTKISLPSAISYIITDLNYIDYIEEYAKKTGQNVEDLENIIEAFKSSAEGFKTIPEFLAHIENVKNTIASSRKNKDEDAVILSTVHGVKGMEFENVYIVNCCENNMPYISSVHEKTNIEEERRLFYVAVTRAIDNLYVFSPKRRRGKESEISRFVKEAEFNVKFSVTPYKEKQKIYHRTYGEGVIVDIKDEKMAIMFKDGVKRTFLADILIQNHLIS